ncbi:MAG: hypothetical protein DYG96_04695 [Chlorobi bacterium CHB2]|nr:hypothetical protein [Chlorobi bacterium CHB2]
MPAQGTALGKESTPATPALKGRPMLAQGTALGKEPTPRNTSPEGAASIRLEMLLRMWISNGCGLCKVDE